MATKSTPIKRKLESNSDTPSKKWNWLSLEDKFMQVWHNQTLQNKFFNKDHEMIPIWCQKFKIFQCSICTHLFRTKFFKVVLAHTSN